MAKVTPRSFKARNTRNAEAASFISALSVISRVRLAGESPVSAEDARHGLDDFGMVDLASRKVDLDRTTGTAPHARLPCSELLARFVQHPRPDRDDEAALFGHRDEPSGGHQPIFRVIPSQQGFDTHGVVAPNLDDGLIEQPQFAALERSVQRVLGVHQVENLHSHGFAENLEAPAASLFRLVHGGIGVGQQRRGLGDAFGRAGNSDAGGDEHLSPGGLEMGVVRACRARSA